MRTLAGIILRFLSYAKTLITKKNGNGKVALKKRTGSNAEYHLTLNQIEKIINTCQCQRDKVLIQVLAFTGIRRAEAAALKINDILLKEKLLIIRFGKGNKQRLVPVPDFVLEDILTLIGQRTTGAIFLGRDGRHLSYRQLNRIVAKTGRVAHVNNPNPKYGNITCHLFRHSFARHWKYQQGSIESLSKILGHTSVKTTWDLYGTESLEDIQKNYETIISKFKQGR